MAQAHMDAHAVVVETSRVGCAGLAAARRDGDDDACRGSLPARKHGSRANAAASLEHGRVLLPPQGDSMRDDAPPAPTPLGARGRARRRVLGAVQHGIAGPRCSWRSTLAAWCMVALALRLRPAAAAAACTTLPTVNGVGAKLGIHGTVTDPSKQVVPDRLRACVRARRVHAQHNRAGTGVRRACIECACSTAHHRTQRRNVTSPRIYVCMYVCMYVCTYIYYTIYSSIYLYIYMHIHMYIHTYTCIHTHTYTYTYTYKYIYIYMYTYTYIYI